MLQRFAKGVVGFSDPRHAAVEEAKARITLPVQDREPEFEAVRLHRERARRLMAGRQRAALLDVLYDEIAHRRESQLGLRLYEHSFEGVLSHLHEAPAARDGFYEPQDMEAHLEASFGLWCRETDQNPVVMALTARCWQILGADYRGGDWAEIVTEEGCAHERRCLERASALLDAVPEGRRGVAWHRMRLEGAMAEEGFAPEERAAIFARCVAADPGSVAAYVTRAQQLLAEPAGAVEAVAAMARDAVARTAAERGASLYAEIYIGLLPYEPLEAMAVDAALMREGLEDMYARAPTPLNANIALRTAWEIGDFAYCRALFEGGRVGEIRPGVWEEPEDPYWLWAMLHLGAERQAYAAGKAGG
ncbi:MAG: hypothetical protein AAF074_04640 [Pseudomonadota bacterium]